MVLFGPFRQSLGNLNGAGLVQPILLHSLSNLVGLLS
jgi:hypothetical protein